MKPDSSVPAIGWPPTNGTPGGRTASTRRMSAALVLPTSVTTVPGREVGRQLARRVRDGADGQGEHDEVGAARGLGRRRRRPRRRRPAASAARRVSGSRARPRTRQGRPASLTARASDPPISPSPTMRESAAAEKAHLRRALIRSLRRTRTPHRGCAPCTEPLSAASEGIARVHVRGRPRAAAARP